MRVCVDCGADISARHGNAYVCRPCRKSRTAVRHKAWYNAHVAEASEQHRAWKAANPERAKELHDRWAAAHRTPRARAQFTHCQMTDCGQPLTHGRVRWCSRCAPFVRRDNAEAWRQNQKRLRRAA